jgi:hypothetical protein
VAPVQLRVREWLENVAVTEPCAPPRSWDWVFAVLLAVLSLALIFSDDALPVLAQLVPAIVAVALVPFRRVVPPIAVVAVFVVEMISVGIALRDLNVEATDTCAGIAFIVLLCGLCRRATRRDVLIGFVVSAASATFVEWAAEDLTVRDWLFVLPWLIVGGFALAMRYRARLAQNRNTEIRLTERNSL